MAQAPKTLVARLAETALRPCRFIQVWLMPLRAYGWPCGSTRTSDYGTTLISGTRGVKNGVKGCPKRHLLHRVDHVTVSRFFLAVQENINLRRAHLPLTLPPPLLPSCQGERG
jgi:hypothetical protein